MNLHKQIVFLMWRRKQVSNESLTPSLVVISQRSFSMKDDLPHWLEALTMHFHAFECGNLILKVDLSLQCMKVDKQPILEVKKSYLLKRKRWAKHF